jgi:hypothetical protein
MANYTVIGGDGKEYGPITGEDLRRWVAEGRLNAQTLAKAESDAEFRPLATFPELAHLFGSAAPVPGAAPVLAAPDTGRQAAADKVKVPAIGLIISSIISLLFSLYSLATIRSIAAQMQEADSIMAQINNPQLQQFMDAFGHFLSGPFGVAMYLFQILLAILILVGAIKMLKLRSYELSYAAAIVAVLPCIMPCCGWFLGLIFGIWAMIVLGKTKPYFS